MASLKTVTERLRSLLKGAGQRRMMAVAMMGLDYGTADIAETTEISFEKLQELRKGQRLTINAIRKAPDEARAYLVQVQKDAAILRGFALSHDPALDSRNLGNVARAAVTLSRDLAKTSPPPQDTKPEPPKPPTRPA